MQCLVFVKFLPDGSLAPEEFFNRINARWSQMEDTEDEGPGNSGPERTTCPPSPKSGICIADYESIEQLAIDLATMPGAGIGGVEVVPLSGEAELQHLSADIRSRRAEWQ